MNRGMLFPIVCFSLILSACGPDLRNVKPEIIQNIPTVTDPPEVRAMVDAIQHSITVYETNLRPVLEKIYIANQKQTVDEFAPLMTAGLRATDQWIISLLEARLALERMEKSGQTPDPKTKRIAVTARSFIQDLLVASMLTLQLLRAGDAYDRSWQEKNLSQLRPENERSFNDTTRQVEGVVKRTTSSHQALTAALQSR